MPHSGSLIAQGSNARGWALLGVVVAGSFLLGGVGGYGLALGDVAQAMREKAGEDLESKYVPSPPDVVDKMLELAELRPGDTVYDLGCGDARIPIAAVQRPGVLAVCVELDGRLIERGRAKAQAAGVADRISFVQGDLFAVDLRQASVVTLFLLPELNAKLRPKLEAELLAGARVVSHWHHVPGWNEEPAARVSALGRVRPVYRWTIPHRKAV